MAVTGARLGILRLNAGRLNYAAPGTPAIVFPPNGSLADGAMVQWAESTATTYDLYFGTTNPPPLAAANLPRATPWYWPTVIYPHGTPLYWRVITRNTLGTSTGPVWTFTTSRPTAPANPNPPDQSIDQAITLTLSWAYVPGVFNSTPVTYEVYFGPRGAAVPIAGGLTAPTYTLPAPLLHDRQYEWWVIESNVVGSTASPRWTFATRSITDLKFSIGGTTGWRVRKAGLAIRDVLNQPNTASFTVEGTAPTVGMVVQFGLGSLALADLIFAGTIESVEAIYEGRPDHRAWRVTCQDHTWGFNRRKVREHYGQQGADLIAFDLMAKYAPAGYTGGHIVSPLPTVQGGIDFTDQDLTEAFANLAQRIGGYWYVDYARDVHLFTSESLTPPDPIVDGSDTLMNDPPIGFTTDLSQVRTRVWVEGGGGQSRSPVVPGATSIPVTDGTWYSGSGGFVVSGPQRIRYAGKGTISGPAAPGVAASATTGNMIGGPYTYKYSWITSNVEGPLSLASAEIDVVPLPTPTTATTHTLGMAAMYVQNPGFAPNISGVNWGDGAIVFPGQYIYEYACTNGAGRQTLPSPTVSIYLGDSAQASLTIQIPPGPEGTQERRVYRSFKNTSGSNNMRLVQVVYGNGGDYTFRDRMSDADLANQEAAPTANTTPDEPVLVPGTCRVAVTFYNANGETLAGPSMLCIIPEGCARIHLAAIPVSPDARTVGRRIYRSQPGGNTTLYRTATIAENVTTTFTLGTTHGFGPVAPTANTTGTGAVDVTGIAPGPVNTTARKLYRVAAGAGAYRLVITINDNTTTTHTDTKADTALGAVANEEAITELLGVPASGSGAVRFDIPVGQELNLYVQVDEAAAQANLAALEGPPSDGIIEHVIQDRRVGLAEATAMGMADLALFAYPIVRITYASRDPKSAAGQTVIVNLPAFGLTGAFVIQSVAISEVEAAPGLYPRYAVEASSVRFSFEDVLRRIQLEQ